MALSNTRFGHLLVICAVSLAVAVACYFMGGIAAEVSNAATKWTPAFKAGGSLAGFLIVFSTLLRGYHRLGGTSLLLKVAVVATPAIRRKTDEYLVSYEVIKRASASKKERSGALIWEAGGPTVHLHDIEEDDLIMLRIKSPDGRIWETDHFSALAPLVQLQEISS